MNTTQTINDIKSFVLLKYEILSNDSNTWDRAEKYPESVNKRWALRCARDVEHLDKTGRAKRCNDLNERYQNGEIEVLDELKEAANAAATTYAAYTAYTTYAAYTAYSGAATYAATYAAYAANTATDREEKWKLYISWLIEELCEYEEKYNG